MDLKAIVTLLALLIVGVVTYFFLRKIQKENKYIPVKSCPICKAKLIPDSYYVIKYDYHRLLNHGIVEQEVWICKDCCDNPEKLKEEDKIKNLREKTFEENEIPLVLLAVSNHKNQLS